LSVVLMAKASRKKSSGSKKRPTGPLTAAGLIRFYEEVDVGVKMKPYTLIIIATLFTIAIIVLNIVFGK